MKSKTGYLTFNTPPRRAFISLTPKVANIVAESGVNEGLCHVNAMYISASVFINDDEGGLHQDFDRWLEKLAPYSPESYLHNRTGEHNADAHLKRQVMGREVVVAITNGRLDFGPWEQRISNAFDALKGAISRVGRLFRRALDRLRTSLGNGLGVIRDAFKVVSEKFQEYIMKIIEKMFEFLSQLNAIAERKGFTISKIEVAIPTITISSSIILVPIPEIKLPEITWYCTYSSLPILT